MELNNIDVRVLIKGRPIKEYLSGGDIFVEGREGSPFELQITNRNHFNVEAVLSVDGLSIIDGKLAGPESSGYFVARNDTVIVPGWMLNQDAVAEFVFSGKGKSYATLTTGSPANNGVIGAMVFAEGYNRAPPVRPSRQRQPLPRPAPVIWHGSGIAHQYGSPMNPMLSGSASDVMRGMGVNTISHSVAHSATTQACSATMSQTGAFTSDTLDGGHADSYRSIARSAAPKSAAVNNLGTGFGQETGFRTQEAAFVRGDMIAMMVTYYDNRQGLQARGIDLGGHRKPTPQAFPAMASGCKPPVGWQG